jgi:hypothetical protein
MITISAGQEKIARVNCACCNDDEHYVDIFFNTELDDKDESEFLFEFKFGADDAYPSFGQRLQEFISFFKNEDNYRYNEFIDSIHLKLSQFVEIYEVVREYADKVLSNTEKKLIDNPLQPEFSKWFIKFKSQAKPDLAEVFFFRSEDGLNMFFHNLEDENDPRLMLTEGGIGWSIGKGVNKKTLKRWAWNWLLKRGQFGFREMYCSLTKSETIIFLASLEYIFSNMQHNDKGDKWVTISQ